MADLLEIQRRGAEARAHGLSDIDNPFFKSAAMPAATGETEPQWAAKAQAWQAGWLAEDAMRGGAAAQEGQR
jgi:hypothetical protein